MNIYIVEKTSADGDAVLRIAFKDKVDADLHAATFHDTVAAHVAVHVVYLVD